MAAVSNTGLALLAVGICASIVALLFSDRAHPQFAPYQSEVVVVCVLSVVAFALTVWVIPKIKGYNVRAGLFGRDLNKAAPKDCEKPKVPESMGLVSGIVYILTVIGCQVAFASMETKLPVGEADAAEAQGMALSEYNAALHSIGFMLMLGFVDDVLDLPWRYKLILPSIASLPLLVAYNGLTEIVVPIPLRGIFGQFVDLGLLYQMYMGLLAVFCSNAINIYAGINGLEAGQSLVIGMAVLLHNVIEIISGGEAWHQHFFSLVHILPFLAVTLGLLWYNFYPSRVFVGDTFTYFAGMSLAMTGILGHFSKTLLLFFIPQIFNFLLSTPQLFGIVPCPRHRLPTFNKKTGLLEGNAKHLNLVNYFLLATGPLSERTLCIFLLILQVACCGAGFFVRYVVNQYFY